TPLSRRAFYNSLAGRKALKGPPAVKREAKERMGQKEMVMIAAGECWRSRSLGVFMACFIENAGDATAVSVLLSFALTAVLAQGAASAVCFRGELRPITGLEPDPKAGCTCFGCVIRDVPRKFRDDSACGRSSTARPTSAQTNAIRVI